MVKDILKKREGFTLIEIVLVLAIAGLIILLVFLALQGAQRAQQDQARKDFVNRVAAACNKVISDHPGTSVDCSSGAFLPEVQTDAGTGPSISGTPMTATTGAASTTNVNVATNAASVKLSNSTTFTVNY